MFYTKNIGVRKKLKVHTGGVDGFWNIMKKGVPKSLPSKSTKKIGCISKVHIGVGKTQPPTCSRRRESSSRSFEMGKEKSAQRMMCVGKHINVITNELKT